jgi:hypothetical protein
MRDLYFLSNNQRSESEKQIASYLFQTDSDDDVFTWMLNIEVCSKVGRVAEFNRLQSDVHGLRRYLGALEGQYHSSSVDPVVNAQLGDLRKEIAAKEAIVAEKVANGKDINGQCKLCKFVLMHDEQMTISRNSMCRTTAINSLQVVSTAV